MISKTDVLKMARSVFKRSQGYAKPEMTNPAREWLIGIGIFVVLVAVGGVFHWYTYAHYSELELSIQHSEVKVETYKERLAEQARTAYIARKTDFQALQNTGARDVLPVETGSSTTTIGEGEVPLVAREETEDAGSPTVSPEADGDAEVNEDVVETTEVATSTDESSGIGEGEGQQVEEAQPATDTRPQLEY